MDIKTLGLTTSISAVAMALAMVMVWKVLGRESSLREWAAGAVLACAGQILMIFRHDIHDIFSIVVANTFMIMAAGYYLIGTQKFLKQKPDYKWVLSATLVTLISFSYYTFVEPLTPVRVAIVSILTVPFAIASGYLLLKYREPESGASQVYTAFFFLIYGLAFFVRAIASLSMENNDFINSHDFINASGFLILAVFQLSVAVGFTMMVSARFQGQLEKLTLEDKLTGIGNRRYFDKMMEENWMLATRYNQEISLVIIDIDYFKDLNDTYGHQTGDECLRSVAQTIMTTLQRETDKVARYGGEEFAVILPNTNLDGAKTVAETLRKAVIDLAIPNKPHDTGENATISEGVTSTTPGKKDSISSFIEKADKNLYTAKVSGRNRCVAS